MMFFDNGNGGQRLPATRGAAEKIPVIPESLLVVSASLGRIVVL